MCVRDGVTRRGSESGAGAGAGGGELEPVGVHTLTAVHIAVFLSDSIL